MNSIHLQIYTYFPKYENYSFIFLFFSSRKGCNECLEGCFGGGWELDGVEVEGGLGELGGDGVLDLLADAELAVDLPYALHFGVGVGGGGGEEGGEFVAEGLGRGLEGFEDKVGFFVVADVLPGLFAELGHVAIAVEEVVLQLEGKAEMDAELVEVVDVGFGGAGIEGADFEGAGKEDGGLEADHHHVVVDGDLGSVLEVHVVLLAFAHFDGCLVEAGEDLVEAGAGLGKEVGPGEGEHGVAGEDGGVLVPFAVDGGLAAADGGTVHEVVVEEGEVVEDFDADGGLAHLAVVAAEHAVGGHEEEGAYAFAAEVEGVFDGLVELERLTEGVFVVEDLCDGVEHGG